MAQARQQKLIELGQSLLRKGDFEKRLFLETYTVLSRQEAAAVLGCRPRDLHSVLLPDYFLNGRPKYKIASVLAKQNELIAITNRIRS